MQKLNILIYFPYNIRTVEQQSIMEMLVKQGYNVILLTTCDRSFLHNYVEKFGVKTEYTNCTNVGKLKFYFYNIKKLLSVIHDYQVDVIIAHQQIPALIAGVVGKFKKFKLVYLRHNSDEDYQNFPIKAWFLNKIVNILTPVKVAPSSIVERFWIENEKVTPSQIRRINYGYNFNQYESPVLLEVDKIRGAYPAKLLVLSIARLVSAKRHQEMFSVIARLAKEGLDIKMICLGNGPLKEELIKLLQKMNIQKNVFLLGRRENVFDYIQAADVFMHLSSTEASNSAVKEVGLCKKPIIVCKSVGDFDDYVVNGINGFLVSKKEPSEEAYNILKAIAENKINKILIGTALKKTITTNFDVNKVASDYEQLIKTAVH